MTDDEEEEGDDDEDVCTMARVARGRLLFVAWELLHRGKLALAGEKTKNNLRRQRRRKRRRCAGVGEHRA